MMEAEDYTFAEMADIHFFYSRANGNAHEARRLYQVTFPNRRLPCSRTFSRIAQRLRERGAFILVIEGGRPRTARTVQQKQRILARVAANPGTCTRKISSAEGVHRSTVWRILHEDRLYPYHLHRVQGLKPEDLSRRVTFCQWCLEQCVRNPQFLWSYCSPMRQCLHRMEFLVSITCVSGHMQIHTQFERQDIRPHS
jgi:hypothetical protein